MQKIFVTGGTGFVGSYLLRYLVQQGYQNIKAVKRTNSSMALVAAIQDKIQWIEGDILDIPFLEAAMEGVTHVYHCAAVVSFEPKAAEKMKEVNIEGTANMVNMALHHQVEKMLYISSVAALGTSKPKEWQDEQTKWKEDKNNSNYGKSKYRAEMEVWRGIMEGLNAAIICPSLILGSGFWNSGTGNIFRLYGNGFPFYAAGIGGLVDVRDVARAAIQLMESDIKEERFVVSGENIAYQDLFTQIAIAAVVKPPAYPINSLLTGIGWRLEWLKSSLTGIPPTITRESARSAANQTYYRNQKLIDALNFQYTPITQTIQETVKQFKQAQQNGLSPMFLPLN